MVPACGREVWWLGVQEKLWFSFLIIINTLAFEVKINMYGVNKNRDKKIGKILSMFRWRKADLSKNKDLNIIFIFIGL